MASFETKTVRDRLRMIQKKCYHSDPFQPDPEQGIPEKQQEKKNHYGLFSRQNVMAQAENERKKNYRSDPLQPYPEQEIPKQQQRNAKN